MLRTKQLFTTFKDDSGGQDFSCEQNSCFSTKNATLSSMPKQVNSYGMYPCTCKY